MSKAEATCPPEEMDSEDPLFIIYTSGTSEQSKGVVHTQAGYLLYAAVTHQVVHNMKLATTHSKNTSLTSTTFSLSELHQCDQGMLPNRYS